MRVLLSITLSIGIALTFISTSHAGWQCTSTNSRGMQWHAYGYDAVAARTRALEKCAPFSRQCGIISCEETIQTRDQIIFD